MSEADLWEASKFCQSLLHIGPFVPRYILPDDLKDNFMKFLAFTCIKSSKKWCRYYQLFKNNTWPVVAQCISLYGGNKTIFIVHSCIHLPDDMETFGSLDSFSAFSFESYVQIIRSNITSNNMLEEQIVRCIKERTVDISLYEPHPIEDDIKSRTVNHIPPFVQKTVMGRTILINSS